MGTPGRIGERGFVWVATRRYVGVLLFEILTGKRQGLCSAAHPTSSAVFVTDDGQISLHVASDRKECVGPRSTVQEYESGACLRLTVTPHLEGHE